MSLLAGCDHGDAPATGGTGGGIGGVAVICSDYSSTSVALLDAEAREVLAPAVIHSGSAEPRVQTALGGDVDLPTTPPADGMLLLLDRFPNAVLTFVDPADGEVRRQVNVRSGFSSNPHDALVMGDGRLAVTRYNPNPDPGAAGTVAQGDDLLVVGPDGSFEHSLGFTEPDGFPGRPDRMVPVGDELWITLGRVARDWSAYREGRVARVRVGEGGAPEEVGRIALPHARNCSRIARRGDRIAVTCAGSWFPGRADFDPTGAAVVLLNPQGEVVDRLGADDPRVERSFAPGVAFDEQGRVHVTLFGSDDGTPDAVVRWDPSADEVERVHESEEPWSVWSLTDTPGGAVVVPDADRRAPRVCRLGSSTACLEACAATGLPPRAVGRFVSPP